MAQWGTYIDSRSRRVGDTYICRGEVNVCVDRDCCHFIETRHDLFFYPPKHG